MELFVFIVIFCAVIVNISNANRKTKKSTQPNRNPQTASVQSHVQQIKRQQTTRNSHPQKPDIVQRAVANNTRFEEDTTREAIEAMHGHSETEQKVAMEHSRKCQTLGRDGNNSIKAESLSMFGSVEDLIVMGYSGNLEFERDFLGEGLDMINNL